MFGAELLLAKNELFEFVKSVYKHYEFIWYHKLISDRIQNVIEGNTKNLMLFVPPQHQKSTIASRAGIAWALGKNPNLRIIHCAYGSDLVEGFSKDIQRIIDSQFYNSVFENTVIGGNGYVKTVEKWEIKDKKGSYVCAGVGGGITGKSCDIGIIDDPIKGAESANSQTIRDKIWDWYLQDFRTRLHNDSRQIIIQTRWHDDDLAGKILKQEPEKWEVISLPAIKDFDSIIGDNRKEGEALHPSMHSLERLLEIKKLSPRTFAALYQQKPVIEGGNIIKSEWFNECELSYLQSLTKIPKIDFFLDTAFTKKTTNDPSGIIATTFIGNKLFILNASKVRLEFPDLIKYIETWTKENGYTNTSSIRIEPKANGISIIQVLKKSFNVVSINSKITTVDKETRLSCSAPFVESGKVYLVKGIWNDLFKDEICGFPNKKHDEYVDLISYAIDYYSKQNSQSDWGIKKVN